MRKHNSSLLIVIFGVVCGLIVFVFAGVFFRQPGVYEHIIVSGSWGSGERQFGLLVSEDGREYGPTAFAVSGRGDRIAIVDTYNSRLLLIRNDNWLAVETEELPVGIGLCSDQVFVLHGDQLSRFDWSGIKIDTMPVPTPDQDRQLISRSLANFPAGTLLSDLVLTDTAMTRRHWQLARRDQEFVFEPVGTTTVGADGLKVREGLSGNTVALAAGGVICEDVTGEPTVRYVTRGQNTTGYALSIPVDVKAGSLQGSDSRNRVFMRFELLTGDVTIVRYPRRWQENRLVVPDWSLSLPGSAVILRVDTQIDSSGSVYHAAADSSGYVIKKYTFAVSWGR